LAANLTRLHEFKVVVDRLLMNVEYMKEVILIMKAIQLNLDDELHRRAKTRAYQTGVTPTEFVRRAIEDKVERPEDAPAVPAPQRRPQ